MTTSRERVRFYSLLVMAQTELDRQEYGPVLDAIVKEAMLRARDNPDLLEDGICEPEMFDTVTAAWKELRGSHARSWMAGSRIIPIKEMPDA